MNCPKCVAAMDQVDFDGIEVDRCSKCHGIWFDLREHEHLKTRRKSEAIDTGDVETGRQQNAVRKIDCPRCKTRMVQMTDPDQHHLRYESCPVCYGVYFDAGEFRDFKSSGVGDLLRSWVRSR